MEEKGIFYDAEGKEPKIEVNIKMPTPHSTPWFVVGGRSSKIIIMMMMMEWNGESILHCCCELNYFTLYPAETCVQWNSSLKLFFLLLFFFFCGLDGGSVWYYGWMDGCLDLIWKKRRTFLINVVYSVAVVLLQVYGWTHNNHSTTQATTS